MVLAIVIAPARRLPPDKLKAAKLEFQLMMDLGIYRPSDSPWTNPHHMVKKLRRYFLETLWGLPGTKRCNHPWQIPDPTHHGFQCAACLGEDLFKGGHRAFHHITVEQQDIKKTTVNTLFGLFEFRKMPFGLKNAAQSWQRFINSVLKEFDFVFACRDDLLIASFSKEQHFKHLRLLFAQLENFNINHFYFAKCVFWVTEISYLVYLVKTSGILPQPDRVKSIAEFPPSNQIWEQRKFLGLITFYRRTSKTLETS